VKPKKLGQSLFLVFSLGISALSICGPVFGD
jgi:hypothetical protein